MDFIQGIQDKFSGIITNTFGSKPEKTKQNDIANLVDFAFKIRADSLYSKIDSNWYKALPYGFKYEDRYGTSYCLFLPISPSNLNITTHFSTNVIATAYGTVEEHSEQRYFDIAIEGTTGMSPKYVDVAVTEMPTEKLTGRQAFASSSIFDTARAFGMFSQTIGAVERIANKASDIMNSTQSTNKSGVDVSKTGYAAFHNLYRFFLLYKKDLSGEDLNGRATQKSTPLVFFNYKDNNKYSCSIQKFVLRRTAENPMLYFYSIVLRGYKIDSVDEPKPQEELAQRTEDLGLDGIRTSSILGSVKNVANDARSIFGAAKGGINILGR